VEQERTIVSSSFLVAGRYTAVDERRVHAAGERARHEAVSDEAPALLRVHPALTAPGDPAGTLLGQPSAFRLGTHMVIWARGLSSY
jgi:hypothetical protein